MPRKIKHKSSQRDYNYSKISKKLSVVEKQIYYGYPKKIVYGIDAMQTLITKQALKVFYEYLKIELQKKDQTRAGLQAVYVFVDKCIFESAECIECIRKTDIDKLKQQFKEYYEKFLKDTVDNSTLVNHLLNMKGGTNIYDVDSMKFGKSIIQRVYDYIDFIDLYYVSQILIQDNLIVPLIKKHNYKTFPRDISKETNKTALNIKIKDEVLAEKMSLFHQTMIIIKKDLALYLSDKKYEYVKTLVLDRYNEYYQTLLESIRLKDNFASKIRSQKSFFEMMDQQKMNWVYNYSESNGGSSKSFYVFIYDIVMLKYRLLTYLLRNEYKKKPEQEILKLLDEGAPYPKDDKVFDLFSTHIQSEGDINAYIVKFFGIKYQKFIKILLAIETRTKYKQKERVPLFYSLDDISFKYNPIVALRYFPMKKTRRARLAAKSVQVRSKSNIRLKYKNYNKRKQGVLENLSESDKILNSKESCKKDIRLHKA